MIKKEEVLPLINLAFEEDIKDGDHSSLSCIPNNKIGKAQLIVKDQGIIRDSKHKQKNGPLDRNFIFRCI